MPLTGKTIILVDNLFYSSFEGRISTSFSPHLGLISISSICSGKGANCIIYDPKILFSQRKEPYPTDEYFIAVANEILDLNPNLIGFTAYGLTFPYAARIAEFIKKKSVTTPTIMGGPHATLYAQRILERYPQFDIIARHECETDIVYIIQAAMGEIVPDLVKNIAYRKDDKIILTARNLQLPEADDLPFSNFTFYPAEKIKNEELPIEAGRGCPFQCTFCSTANFFSRQYRLKSTVRMVQELDFLNLNYGTSRFNLNHDLFGLRKKDLQEFCEAILDRGYSWCCSMRPDTVDLKMIPLLKKAGCNQVYFGFEVGTIRMQKVIKKFLDIEKGKNTLKRFLDAGVKCEVSFITGFPEETEDDLVAAIDIIGELLLYCPTSIMPQLHILSPEPGSELAAQSSEQLLFDGVGPEGETLHRFDLICNDPILHSVFYHYPSHVKRRNAILASNFISTMLPQLGYSIVAHLTAQYFFGRLSRFLDAIKLRSTFDLTKEAALLFLNTGLHVWANTAPLYVKELLLFSKIKHLASTLHNLETAESETPLMHGVTIFKGSIYAKFQCDILKLIAHIELDPLSVIPLQMVSNSNARTLMFTQDTANQVHISSAEQKSLGITL